jgi:hypothetical protein
MISFHGPRRAVAGVACKVVEAVLMGGFRVRFTVVDPSTGHKQSMDTMAVIVMGENDRAALEGLRPRGYLAHNQGEPALRSGQLLFGHRSEPIRHEPVMTGPKDLPEQRDFLPMLRNGAGDGRLNPNLGLPRCASLVRFDWRAVDAARCRTGYAIRCRRPAPSRRLPALP